MSHRKKRPVMKGVKTSGAEVIKLVIHGHIFLVQLYGLNKRNCLISLNHYKERGWRNLFLHLYRDNGSRGCHNTQAVTAYDWMQSLFRREFSTCCLQFFIKFQLSVYQESADRFTQGTNISQELHKIQVVYI